MSAQAGVQFVQQLEAAKSGDMAALDVVYATVEDWLRDDPELRALTAWESGQLDHAVGTAVYALICEPQPARDSLHQVRSFVQSRATVEAFLQLRDAALQEQDEAVETLYQLIAAWCGLPAEGAKPTAGDKHNHRDAMHHAMIKLLSRVFDPDRVQSLASVKSWVKTVVRNYLKSTQKQLKRQTHSVPLISLAPQADDEPDLLDSVAPLDGFPDFGYKLYEFARELDQVHATIKSKLTATRSQHDSWALYLLECRLQIYAHLERANRDLPVAAWQLMEIAESVVDWPQEDGARCIAPNWPSITDIWRELRTQFRSEHQRITDARLLEVVTVLQPDVECSVNRYQQWRRRLRKKLMELREGELDGAFSTMARVLWECMALGGRVGGW